MTSPATASPATASPATAGRVVDALVAGRLVDPGAADRARAIVEEALGAPGSSAPGVRSAMPRVLEVVAYLGGALVLAAGLLFVLQQWGELGDGGRTAALVLVTAVLAVAGLAARGADVARRSPIRRRLAGTLLTGAAVVAGLAAGQALEAVADYDYRDVYWPAVVGGAVVALVAALSFWLARSPLAQLAMLGGAVTAVSAWLGHVVDREGLALGLAYVTVAVVWLLVTEAGVFGQHSVGRILGAALALFGAQFVILAGDEPWPGYLLTLVVVVAAVVLYLAVLDWPYLAAAVLGVTFLVPEVVSDWAGDSLGIVGGVLIAGATLLAASFAGYRLREEAE